MLLPDLEDRTQDQWLIAWVVYHMDLLMIIIVVSYMKSTIIELDFEYVI